MNIDKYQQLYLLNQTDISEMEKHYHYYSIIKNKTFDEVSALPIAKILKIPTYVLNPKMIFPYYRIGWRFYKINLNILHNIASDNMAVIAFGCNESSLVENLHKILATITKRKNRSPEYFEQLAEKIKAKVNINFAYGVTVFFLNNYSIENMTKIMTKQMLMITQKIRKLK